MYTTNLQFYNGILISEKIILFNNNMKLLQEKLAKYDAPKDVLQKDVESIVEKLRGIGAIEE